MLLLMMAIAAAPPVAADATGMEPQLTIIRRDAAERGWAIICEGRSGEEGVVRLAFPPDTTREAIDAYFDPNRYVGSSAHFYSSEGDLPSGCDHEPPTISASQPVRTLAFGPRGHLDRLAELARACGFARAAVRERRNGDLPEGTTGMPEDWLTLDAGEDIGSRYGPSLCFLNIQGRVMSTGSAEVRR